MVAGAGAPIDRERQALHTLAPGQAAVLQFVEDYHRLTGSGCPASIIAHSLRLHHETVRGHFAELCRKGWLVSPSSPAVPRRPRFLDKRR